MTLLLPNKSDHSHVFLRLRGYVLKKSGVAYTVCHKATLSEMNRPRFWIPRYQLIDGVLRKKLSLAEAPFFPITKFRGNDSPGKKWGRSWYGDCWAATADITNHRGPE